MACSGTPSACIELDQGWCAECGCTWRPEPFNFCAFTPSACDTHGSQSVCEACGCNWAVGTNVKINIGDAWKDASEIKINIGDVWKPVTEIWINIGDAWKRVF